MDMAVTNSTLVEMPEENHELPREEVFCVETNMNSSSQVDFKELTRLASIFYEQTIEKAVFEIYTQTDFPRCSFCNVIDRIYKSYSIPLTDLFDNPNRDEPSNQQSHSTVTEELPPLPMFSITNYSPQSGTEYADKASQASACMSCMYKYSKYDYMNEDQREQRLVELRAFFKDTNTAQSYTWSSGQNLECMESSSQEFNNSQVVEVPSSVTLLNEDSNISPSRADPNSGCFLGAKETIKLQVIDPLIRRVEDMHKRYEEEHLNLLKELDNVKNLVDEIYKNAMKE